MGVMWGGSALQSGLAGFCWYICGTREGLLAQRAEQQEVQSC